MQYYWENCRPKQSSHIKHFQCKLLISFHVLQCLLSRVDFLKTWVINATTSSINTRCGLWWVITLQQTDFQWRREEEKMNLRSKNERQTIPDLYLMCTNRLEPHWYLVQPVVTVNASQWVYWGSSTGFRWFWCRAVRQMDVSPANRLHSNTWQRLAATDIQVYSAPARMTATGGWRMAGEGGEGVQPSTTHSLTFLTSPLKDCYLNKWRTGINALGSSPRCN